MNDLENMMIFNNREYRDKCRALTLQLMRDNQIRKRQEIYQEVIRLGGFSDEVLDLRFDFGQSKVENAIAWAITSLTKAGILNRISKATYQITPTGLKVAQLWQNKTEISEKLYDEVDLPEWVSYLKSRAEIKNRKKNRQTMPRLKLVIMTKLILKLKPKMPLKILKLKLRLNC
ncbi:winged helix-turn-helix domain-containing protein [Moraxella equi]|uniref:Restriction system protein Mrr-like N-terminal domain-containing protein n=1 Tax=Moraxella equi TaxID=60442 RepID=A0A378QWD0_9GAMM|nr:winged helix-turn-helix domain-containing protein [Moraxella equi]STZ04732.1 Uncharacterised protein [Moraxella equi]